MRGQSNLVPRVLRLFGQRLETNRCPKQPEDSGYKIKLSLTRGNVLSLFPGGGGGGGGGGYLGSVLLGMCRWPLRAPAPL